MHTRRHTFVATLLVALLTIAGVTAAIAADPAQPPPPKIAFVANGRVPADALAAGPIAGQLGAPVYTTEQTTLPDSTRDALAAYGPELVIVLGGPVAITDDVVNAIAAAVGLPTVAPTPPPTTGVVRAAGADRFATATVVADLLSAYDPAYLGVDLQSVDADLLDGKDSSEFAKAKNGGTAYVWGNQSGAASYTPNTTYSYNSAGGPITITRSGPGDYTVEFSGLNMNAGHVQVTRYTGNGYCNSTGWGGNVAGVQCYDENGVAEDARFDLLFLN